MHTNYTSPAIKQLRDQQVRFVPREKKVAQVDKAEQLLRELDLTRTYSYEYLCFRVTDYRPTESSGELIGGEDAAHDLRLFIEDLSDAAGVRIEDVNEPVRTVTDLSRMFNVSTKTVSRWRDQGLVSRRFLFGTRKRVGFLQSSVDRFVSENRDRVARGERFSQLNQDDRDKIVERARRLAHAGGCPSEIARRIAKHMNRSVETIRYTLKQFDAEHPDLAVFPNATGRLTEEAKQRIYQQHRRGISVETLAKRHCRTRTSIYRVVNEMRATRILELPLDFMPNDEFKEPNAKKRILAPTPAAPSNQRRVKAPSGLPLYLASLYEVPLLTKEQEQHLFRKYNYLKYRAAELRKKLTPSSARAATMDKIEQFYEEAVQTKNKIVQANLRLVVSIAKRHVNASEDFFHLISDGNMSLIRAVEKFDYARGNKFSTYASWAIMKNFARTIPEEFKRRERFRTTADEVFSSKEDIRSDAYEQETAQQLRQEQVGKILSRLDAREQKIIISRFGLDHRQEPRTLKEVGEELGVTKERIRQIEARALNKLRSAAQDARIEAPEQ